MKPRGKRIAIISIALGILVISVTVYALIDSIREEYYIWKLESEDEDEIITAVDALVKISSKRAIPKLIKLAEENDKFRDIDKPYKMVGYEYDLQPRIYKKACSAVGMILLDLDSRLSPPRYNPSKEGNLSFNTAAKVLKKIQGKSQ